MYTWTPQFQVDAEKRAETTRATTTTVQARQANNPTRSWTFPEKDTGTKQRALRSPALSFQQRTNTTGRYTTCAPNREQSVVIVQGLLLNTSLRNKHMGNQPSAEKLSNSLSPQTSLQHPLLNPNPDSVKTAATLSTSQMNNEQPFTQHNENSVSAQDVTMSGTGQSRVNLASAPSAMNIDEQPENTHVAPPRRRSTLILTDDPELEKLKLTKHHDDGAQTPSKEFDSPMEEDSSSQIDKIDPNAPQAPTADHTVPVEIQWLQGGENVFITGSFTGWRKMIKLIKESDAKSSIKLRLPEGTHRFRFIVDNELRFSDYLPTATDQMGNFVNYIEIQSPESSQVIQDQVVTDQTPSQQQQQDQQQEQPTKKDSNLGLTNDDDDMGGGYSRFHEMTPLAPELQYVRDIPAIFTDPSVMEQYYVTLDNNQNQNQSWLTPPQLPPHLESVILNNYSNADKSNSSGALPIPNHVVLNHLATTSIKHNTLAVASVVRYKRKYVTQVLYAPLQ